jgi:N-acetylneuraminate synthase
MIEIIAELGINHNAYLGIAKKLIDVAASAGLDYIKLQKRDINLVYSKEELDKPRESPWGTTTKEQKQGLEFSELDYLEIDEYCQNKRIKWFGSPWDVNSAAFLGAFDIPFIKIPSALITNLELLDVCKQIGKPVILSTGMSTFEQIGKAISIFNKPQIECIMHCTSTYPTDPLEVNIKCIPELKERYPWTKIGFSNHYPGLMAMTLAAAYGIEMLEFHITLDRTMYGSDQAASIEPSGTFELVQRLKLIRKMMGDGKKKVYDSEVPIMKKLRKVL